MQLEKVTAFVTPSRPSGAKLLLFRHPFAGVQLPAGAVAEGERADIAATREVSEETGLAEVFVVRSLGIIDKALPGRIYVARRTKVYARPELGSFNWAEFRRGIAVRPLRATEWFTQITVEPQQRWLDYVMRDLGYDFHSA